MDGLGVAGINQNCKVRVDKITDDDPLDPQWFLWAAARALEWVVFEEGARVVNCSFYGAHSSLLGFYAFRDALIAVNEDAPGTVVLCCSGNSGTGGGWKDKLTPPADWSCDLECVIAVGASTTDDVVWEDTEWRPGDDGGQLSLLAPGEPNTYWTTHNDGSWVKSTSVGGTSGATAHASGIAGIVLSKYPGLQNMEIRERLQNACERISLPQGFYWGDSDCWGLPCWCERVGSGRMDALRSLAWKIFVRCPRAAGGTGFSPPRFSGDIPVSGRSPVEVTVYDLLGRRLCHFELSNGGATKAGILALVRARGDLPSGARFVPARSADGVRAWRVVP